MAENQYKGDNIQELRSENSKLKAENSLLQKQLEDFRRQPKSKRTGRSFIRKLSVVLLVAFAVALLAVGNLLFWFGNTVVKQDRFVSATEPIIKNQQVQQSLALYTTNQIFQNVDVQKFTEEVLPPRADFLAPQLTSQLKSGTKSLLEKRLATQEFQNRWNTVMARQHDRLVTFAANYQGSGEISLNNIYTQLDDSLKSTKLSFLADKKLPSKVGNITVVNATWLPTFHKIVINIDTWRTLAIVLDVLCIVGAVWLSRNRRRTIYTFCAWAFAALFAVLIALRIFRQSIVDKADPQYASGVQNALHIFFQSFVGQTGTIMVLLALVAIVAWISGGSRYAVATRTQVGLLFSGKLHTRIFGDTSNGFILWVQRHKRLLEWLVVGIIAVIVLLAKITLTSLLLYVLLLVVLILLIEFIGGQKPD